MHGPGASQMSDKCLASQTVRPTLEPDLPLPVGTCEISDTAIKYSHTAANSTEGNKAKAVGTAQGFGAADIALLRYVARRNSGTKKRHSMLSIL